MSRRCPEMVPGYWCVNGRKHLGSRPAQIRGPCAECEALDRRVALAAEAFAAAVSSRAVPEVAVRAPLASDELSADVLASEELSAAREAVAADEAERNLVVRRPSYEAALRALDPGDVAVVALMLARPAVDMSVAAARLDRTRQEVYRACARILNAGLLFSVRGQR